MEQEPTVAPVVAPTPPRLIWHKYWVRHPLPDSALAHRSRVFATILAKLGMAGIATAVSSAELGPFGGAPRNPNLGAGRPEYSTVRYADEEYPYTQIVTSRSYCPRCGYYNQEKHTLELREPDQVPIEVGYLKVCTRCDKDHWLFISHMPSSESMRKMRARSVP